VLDLHVWFSKDAKRKLPAPLRWMPASRVPKRALDYYNAVARN